MTSKLVEFQLEKTLRNPRGSLENPALKDLEVHKSQNLV